MTRVLVVESAADCRASSVLAADGFTVFTAMDTPEAIESLQALHPDVVLLEVTTPDARTLAMCTAIRAAAATPLVVLSGPCAERDAVAVYTTGADAMVTEPVGVHELVARVRALVRRIPVVTTPPDDVFVVGPITLDRGRREISVAGQLVSVPRREFEIAELLMREAGRVVPRERIVREIWGTMRDTKSLDVQVGRLRARLLGAAGQPCITTVRGVGFRFVSGADLAEPRREEIELDLVVLEPGSPDDDVVSPAQGAGSR
jgi:two-component system, OmpR family, response regulator RegX3